jgi:hypothetical protein
MAGGPPVQMIPGYGQPFPGQQPIVFQQPLSQTAWGQPAGTGWSIPPGAPALQDDPRRPLFRGQMPEQAAPAPAPPPRPEPLALPSPEQLGLVAAPAAGEQVDLNAALQQARRLGVTGFNLNQLPDGSYQVALRLPTCQPDRTQHVEATARTEAAAVRLALERAEQWATTRR